MTKLDEFYHDQQEPLRSCLLAIRDLILAYNAEVQEKWYYRLPCFFHNNNMFCYVWVDKKTSHPYIAFYPGRRLLHPSLVQGNRVSSKCLTIDPNADIPLDTIYEIIEESFLTRKRLDN